MHMEYLIRNQSLRRKVLAIYRPDRKLAGTIGDGRALQMMPGPCRGRQSIKMTAGPYRQIPFPIRLQGPAVNSQDCRLYERQTPCPAVRTHPARDARDYSPSRALSSARDGWEHWIETISKGKVGKIRLGLYCIHNKKTKNIKADWESKLLSPPRELSCLSR